MAILIAALVFASVSLLVIALTPARATSLQARLGAYQYAGPLTERDVQLERPLVSRLSGPIFEKVIGLASRLTPQRANDEARRLMVTADWSMDLGRFMVIRTLAIVGAPLLYVLALGIPHTLLGFALVGLLGWFGSRMPINWLRGKAAARQKKMQRALPDTLDLITVSVEAGLGLDAALGKVVEKTRGPLRDEFGRVLQEIGLGQLRRVAMKDMAIRCDLAELSSFVSALIQADQMGLGLGEVLRTQSDEMRIKRRQRAEETAMKAPVKMLFPLVACIFPAMMTVLLGPAVWAVYVNIVAGGGFSAGVG